MTRPAVPAFYVTRYNERLQVPICARFLSRKVTMQENASKYADSLAAPAPRTHVHTRNVVYRGYRREDGLWDIEAELTDTKTYDHQRSDGDVLRAGEPVHGMVIRLTVDDHMKITAVAMGMPAAPFAECQQAR